MGKLAKLGPEKTLLDLGSGKGFPSLLWASAFGVSVEGFDLDKEYVKYANACAKLLNLEHLAKYLCQDARRLRLSRKYDALASLGIGITEVYGTAKTALKNFRLMLNKGGFLILAEPVWLMKSVPKELQKALKTPEENLCTKAEMESLLEIHGFEVQDSYVSAKEDWEYYIRPANVAMRETMKREPELSSECEAIINGFQAEYHAVGKYWNMILWVAMARE